MDKREIIQMIKDAWVRALMDEKDIREDIAESYSAWVKGLIQQAAPELSGVTAQAMQGENPEGGGAPSAMPQQGGMMQTNGGAIA